VLVRGEMQLPVRLLYRPIAYKYVVCPIKGKDVHWEYSEFREHAYGSIVDRSLNLLDRYKKKNGNINNK
jgi:hypothetical protein